eukprot:SAG31_NODE_14516_length_802_cov_1.241821_2_plen_151_part_00
MVVESDVQAGRMVATFGLREGSSWRGVPEAIGEQLRARQGDSSSVQERLIMAALESITEFTPAERVEIKQLFRLFALVPEDTYLCTDAMQMMFHAVFQNDDVNPVSHFKLRMYLQTLIGRSLVLGTIERPQLHDIGKHLLAAVTSMPSCR